ncbi:MAG: hypothetical protein ACO2OZ_02655 [Acidilobaceae archaeon]
MYSLRTPLLHRVSARNLIDVRYRCLSLSSLVYIASRYFSWYVIHVVSPAFPRRSLTA